MREKGRGGTGLEGETDQRGIGMGGWEWGGERGESHRGEGGAWEGGEGSIAANGKKAVPCCVRYLPAARGFFLRFAGFLGWPGWVRKEK